MFPRVSTALYLQLVLGGQRWSGTGKKCEGAGTEKLAVSDGMVVTQCVHLCEGLLDGS